MAVEMVRSGWWLGEWDFWIGECLFLGVLWFKALLKSFTGEAALRDEELAGVGTEPNPII